MVSSYGALTIYGIGFFFQFLGTFGAATSVNMFIWEWIVYRGGQILTIVYLTLMFLSYRKVMIKDAVSFTASTIRSSMEGDIGAFFAIMGSVGVIYASNYRVWKQGMT